MIDVLLQFLVRKDTIYSPLLYDYQPSFCVKQCYSPYHQQKNY